ncbi:MAG: DNA repair protein, partial [Comamonadaceae bacterium]|nr:DNA repair protein [Comamonadaceae bacterium]
AQGGIKLGTHTFTVNKQPLDLTLVAHGDGLAWQITGTDYLAPAHDARLESLRPFWPQALVSETPQLARAEYLAAEWLESTDWDELLVQLQDGESTAPLESLRRFAASRYQEGYQRGIHDDDALAIVRVLAPMQAAAGLLLYGPAERALAQLYWHQGLRDETRQSLARRARSAQHIAQLFTQTAARDTLEHEAALGLRQFVAQHPALGEEWLPELAQALDADAQDGSLVSTLAEEAAAYLVRELAQAEDAPHWAISGTGEDLLHALQRALDHGGLASAWQRDLQAAEPLERWRLARGWLRAFAASQNSDALAWIDDAATALTFQGARRRVNVQLNANIDGLRGEHPRIREGTLPFHLNDFRRRVRHHRSHAVQGFTQLQALRHELLVQEKSRLHLAQFQAKPLATFVRNRLIDEVYL